MKKYYAGIGSRKTPTEIVEFMTHIAEFLFNKNYILRSGAAPGADFAFEKGVPEKEAKEIYIPWEGFQRNKSRLFGISEEAFDLAKKFHPAWERLGKHGKRLIARNGYQVLGEDLSTPVDFIVCWTEKGKVIGGTGQALRIAKSYKIPVFNLAKQKDYMHIKECIKTDQIFVKEKSNASLFFGKRKKSS